jgi:phosphotransferase system HPr (HPr) family protein
MADLRLVVLDPAGLHARPAAQVVRTASRFTSRITIDADGRTVDVKSLIAVLGLTIRPRAEITLSATGPDADDAIAALVRELGAAVEPSPSSPNPSDTP